MSVDDGQQERSDEKAILNILNRVQESVHSLDYKGVRDLIPDDGLYFGSVANVARGYDELLEKQFLKVWPNITGFSIPAESISIHLARPLAWATCLFESGSPGDAGGQRHGRMTFVFEYRGDNWVMVHSHDSLTPSLPGS